MAVIYSQNGVIVKPKENTIVQGSVELFGKTYTTIKINGLEWICENLDYKWSELPIGHNTTSIQACYVNDNESTWGWEGRKCGLLYNNAAMKYLQENILDNDVWRVCTIDDIDKLAISTNAYFNAGYHLSVNESWGTLDGDNSLLFSEKPCGACVASDGFVGTGQSFYINLYTSLNKYMAYRRNDEMYQFTYGDYSGNWYTPIRLVRDAT